MRSVIVVLTLLIATVATLDAGEVRLRTARIVPFDGAPVDRSFSDAVPQPGWVDMRLWRQLVFNEWEEPAGFEMRRTQVLTCMQATTLDVYLQGAFFGNTVIPESERPAWVRFINDLVTDLLECGGFAGRVTFGEETRELRDGRLNVRFASAAEPEDFVGNSNALAFARTWAYRYTDETFAEWAYSEIVFNPDVDWSEEEANSEGLTKFQKVLIHEFLHVLGFFHVSDAASIMHANYGRRTDLDGHELSHVWLAYRIGPGMLYPGFTDSVPALPLVGLLLLAGLLAGSGWRYLRA